MEFPKKRNGSKIKSKWIGLRKRKTKIAGPPKITNFKISNVPVTNDDNGYDCDVENFDEHDVGTYDEDFVPKKQCYGINKEKELICWDKHNIDYCLIYAMKFNTFPSHCCFCNDEVITSFVWCKSCGPLSFYCHDCAYKIHKNTLFHSLVEVQVDGCNVKPFKVKSVLQTDHVKACTSAYSRTLTVISETGSTHQCQIYFCKCTEEFNTLVHLDLWPVTPIKPNTVISMNLLHLFVALQLEGKISFSSFCDGFSWKSGVVDHDLKRYLNRMTQTDSLDQFRHFRRQLTSLKTICPNYDGLEKCASCPKENGSIFYCFDANFGLVLKSSASKSKRLAMRSENLFILDEEVKTFMESYDDTLKTKDCSNFQAGNNLRSKRKTKKLSVTGVFGMSCRHEFPKLFLNMQHGERLGYAVLLLDQILNDTEKKRLDVHIIYDIACVLKSHLQKKNTFTKYQDFKFGIPVFHSYGHRGDCQVKNSIRRLDSFGLMDGELMERPLVISSIILKDYQGDDSSSPHGFT
ncbi:uncharacterized protein [Clytia hemisphaerica]|uniref:CxC2-like cysteine cluster KDZ transposase-associated domain-containing protein n=1 Tax=Clytia hemisphaerica TaxID=252671 RepID=A0A7M5TSE8_9CNID